MRDPLLFFSFIVLVAVALATIAATAFAFTWLAPARSGGGSMRFDRRSPKSTDPRLTPRLREGVGG